jgi:hypothetical protein
LTTIVDVNLDGGANNLDLQALIVRLATLAGGGSSSATAVPEPCSLVCAGSAILALFGSFSLARFVRLAADGSSAGG